MIQFKCSTVPGTLNHGVDFEVLWRSLASFSNSSHRYSANLELTTILNNLLENALRYTDRGGTVEISSSLSGNELLITLADTGIGIAEV
jgi:signal transduction histidine kinase